MTHVLEAARSGAELMRFEHHQKAANMSIAHVEFLLGADEAKRFAADVASCVNGNGDVASKTERLWKTYEDMVARMNANLDAQGGVARRLDQQLQALIAGAAGKDNIVRIERLNDGTKQHALELAVLVIDQYTRETDAMRNNLEMHKHTLRFALQEKTIYLAASEKLAVLADSARDSAQRLEMVADSAKASLTAANEASARAASALHTADEKIAQLEKEASETRERIAQAVRDMQKSAYKKEDHDRPTWSQIQQKPLVCLERATQALTRASQGNGAGENTPTCADCQALKAKVLELDQTLVAQVKENSKLMQDKKDLLVDRQRDKVEMERLAEKMAKLRTENATEKPKKRDK
ncbi:hypothetical protein AAVH_13342 [Aphelenchoides avenae]|nr:hypothetical protein AAVH_13342 [Aphelenchus avenae]